MMLNRDKEPYYPHDQGKSTGYGKELVEEERRVAREEKAKKKAEQRKAVLLDKD